MNQEMPSSNESLGYILTAENTDHTKRPLPKSVNARVCDSLRPMESRLHRSQVNQAFSTRGSYNEARNCPARYRSFPIKVSKFAIQRLLVQQPVQQRQRKTAKIGDTRRTLKQGNKHEESIGEHQRTCQAFPVCATLCTFCIVSSQDRRGLRRFLFKALPPKCSNRVATSVFAHTFYHVVANFPTDFVLRL